MFNSLFFFCPKPTSGLAKWKAMFWIPESAFKFLGNRNHHWWVVTVNCSSFPDVISVGQKFWEYTLGLVKGWQQKIKKTSSDLLFIKMMQAGYLGWNDWWNSCPNTDTFFHDHTIQMGKRGEVYWRPRPRVALAHHSIPKDFALIFYCGWTGAEGSDSDPFASFWLMITLCNPCWQVYMPVSTNMLLVLYLRSRTQRRVMFLIISALEDGICFSKWQYM